MVSPIYRNVRLSQAGAYRRRARVHAGGRWTAGAPGREMESHPDLLWAYKAEVTMRSAKYNLREAEDSVLALSASTEVHRWPPVAVLAVSYFTAIARQFGARVLLEPRGGLVGWRSVVVTPEAGVLV